MSDLMETTQELLRPDVETTERRGWLGRLLGLHEHCFHENPRHSRASASFLVRTCCYCGKSQGNELIPAEHGRYLPSGEEVPWIWEGWRPYVEPSAGYY